MVFSGSFTDINWVQSGSLTLMRSDGSTFCYSGIDGITPLSGCARETTSLILTSSTGTLELRSLG